MGNINIIPFGPQHPVLPEPIHLDLITEDEKVVDAIPQIGYAHRGLEKLVETKDFQEFVFVAERICGICSVKHAMSYVQAVEEIMKLEVPSRAVYMRTIWGELSRIHSHLLWLGLAADAFGFESLFMHSWRLRETILDMFENTTGSRVILSVMKVGGNRRDVDNDTLRAINAKLQDFQKEIKTITDVFVTDFSVQHRLIGVGVLSKEEAYSLGTVGPMLRASGVSSDARMLGYASYKHLDFEPIVETTGDCHARTLVRVREIYQSIDLIRQCVEKIPDGPVDMKVTGAPDGEFFTRVEQPRGEVIYYVKGNGSKYLQRFRVRTPTFANIPAMIKVLKGSQIADVPNIILTIDPCISCTER